MTVIHARHARLAAIRYVIASPAPAALSARDLQFTDGQWIRGKNLDTFCPLGPCIVSGEEIADPQSLFLRTRVNGETVQDSHTRLMLFGVAELLAYCSRNFTLEPADVLLTGTPWGCGEFMTKRSLHPGDVVEVEVEGIGVLRKSRGRRLTVVNDTGAPRSPGTVAPSP